MHFAQWITRTHPYSRLGKTQKDHATLRSLSALIASLPASENKGFREEFKTVCFVSILLRYRTLNRRISKEYEDVQLTAVLSTLTKSANILNDVRYPIP